MGAVTILATGLVGTAVFGVGAYNHWDDISSGSVWLWSSVTGELIRVNANNGQVDLVQEVKDSENHPVRLAQNNRYLVVHDLDTGALSSVDLARMDFTGQTDVGTAGDNHFVLGNDTAVIIDKAQGEVRRVDPETLESVGEPLQLVGPLVGGEFDRDGTLWVASRSQGTVVAIDTAREQPEVIDSIAVSDPGADLVMTVLDTGALAVNRDTGELSVVGGGSTTTVDSPIDLKGAKVPARTVGNLATVTVPKSSSLVALANLNGSPEASSFEVHGSTPETALPFANALFVPYSEEGLVRSFRPDGSQKNTIRVPDAGDSPLELEVRDDHLFINAPESESALVVDPDGRVRKVDKYDPEGEGDGEGGDSREEQEEEADPYVEGPDSDYEPPRLDLPDASNQEDLPEDVPLVQDDQENGRNEDDEDHDTPRGRPEDEYSRPPNEEPQIPTPDEWAPQLPLPDGDGDDDDDNSPPWGDDDHGNGNGNGNNDDEDDDDGILDPPNWGDDDDDEDNGDEEEEPAPGWPGLPDEEEPPAEEEPPVEEPPVEEPPVEEPPVEEPPVEEPPVEEPPVEEPPIEEPPVEQPPPPVEEQPPPPVEEQPPPPVEEQPPPPVEPAPEQPVEPAPETGTTPPPAA
ncbi:midas domain-containing protein [Streptomonospora nanhaiensis]|uniref:hypothetical protein n=1 Tax=Streptomonospora nanhaiensis TaxID=1323731 RepID=UPI001C383CB6|nr:hypothetical protein [Streptomonospora nanhaiensis]MBV2365739.1 hypothetical protein [Streptomonospora nanhaiensis]